MARQNPATGLYVAFGLRQTGSEKRRKGTIDHESRDIRNFRRLLGRKVAELKRYSSKRDGGSYQCESGAGGFADVGVIKVVGRGVESR